MKKFWFGVAVGIGGLIMTVSLVMIGIAAVSLTGSFTRQLLGTISEHSTVSAAGGNYEDSGKGTGDSLFQHSGQSTGRSDAEERELFDSKLDYIMSLIDEYYYDDVSDAEIYDMMLHAIPIALGDPYSQYFSQEEYAEQTEVDNGSYCGVGMVVSQNYSTLVMTITNPYENSPAYNAGIRPNDILIGVDGTDVVGWNLDDVVDLLRGPEGTEVDVTVERDGSSLSFHIVRARIEPVYVSAKMLDDGRTGYIILESFEAFTISAQFNEKVDLLLEQGMERLIIDVRDDGGGLVVVGSEILDRILPKGTLLTYTSMKNGESTYEYALDDEVLEMPIAVLVNENSASCSELFAGALQDNDAAVVVGTQTFGKGIVQWTIPIESDQSAFKMTVEKYFTPSGVCIHGVGITPDVVVELDAESAKELKTLREHDSQLDAAVAALDELEALEPAS